MNIINHLIMDLSTLKIKNQLKKQLIMELRVLNYNILVLLLDHKIKKVGIFTETILLLKIFLKN